MEPLSDRLEAQTMRQQARHTLAEARVDRYLRWFEYRKTTGGIN